MIFRSSKYVPLALLVILIAAWVVSVWFPCFASARTPSHRSKIILNLKWGNLRLFYNELFAEQDTRNFFAGSLGKKGRPERCPHNQYLGKFDYWPIADIQPGMPNTRYGYVTIPLTFLITLVLPLAVGALTRFRFRLWHYFAYTAAVAVQLAYSITTR